MGALLPPGGEPSAGGGFRFRVPQDVFAGNTKALAVAARNAALDAGDVAEFDADPNLLIILAVGDVDIYQARRTNQWRDVANVAPGQPGPPAPPVESPRVVQKVTVPAARTHTLGSNPLRLGPAVAAGQRMLVEGVVMRKPAGRAATGATGLGAFWSKDGAAPRTPISSTRNFFSAPANDRAISGGRIGDNGMSLYLGSSADVRFRSLRDIGAQDQDVSVLLAYALLEFPAA